MNVGDVVVKNSGGELMTVLAVNGGQVEVEGNSGRRAKYPEDALIVYDFEARNVLVAEILKATMSNKKPPHERGFTEQ